MKLNEFKLNIFLLTKFTFRLDFEYYIFFIEIERTHVTVAVALTVEIKTESNA